MKILTLMMWYEPNSIPFIEIVKIVMMLWLDRQQETQLMKKLNKSLIYCEKFYEF